jgi:DNA-binding IclR family transcriptional regulator
MDRVSEPASPRCPTRIQSTDRAATLLTAIAEALEGYTGATVVDGRRLEKELAVVRRDGYRVCVGELDEGLVGVCAALRPGLCRRPVQAASEIEALLR